MAAILCPHTRTLPNATMKPAHAGDAESKAVNGNPFLEINIGGLTSVAGGLNIITCPNATSSMDIFDICFATADDLRHFWYWQLSSCISDLTQNGSPLISVPLHHTFTGAFSTVRSPSSMYFSKVAESPPPPWTIPGRLVYRRLKRGKTFDRPWQP